MNRIIKILLFTILAMNPFVNLNANDDYEVEASEEDLTTILHPDKKDPGVRSVEASAIVCRYSTDHISLLIPNGIEIIYVTIEDGNNVVIWQGVLSSYCSTSSITMLAGKYSITCQADNGVVYKGVLSF